jgi:regulator of protease activity HflC (stomatin/prohibitin superfamily)
MFRSFVVYEHERALHFRDGRLVGELGPGAHRFFGFRDTVLRIGVQPEWTFVFGQEVSTSDGAPVRVSLAVMYAISNLRSWYAFSNPAVNRVTFGSLFLDRDDGVLQVPAKAMLRRWAAARTLEEAMAARESLDADLTPGLTESVAAMGLSVSEVQVIEFVVAGNVKAAYNELLRAELEGRAALARARNEAATMRSLLNTARLVRENPGLLELRILTSGQRPRVNFVVGPPSVADAPVAED